MPLVFDRESGENIDVANSKLEGVLSSEPGRYRLLDDVRIEDNLGSVGQVRADEFLDTVDNSGISIRDTGDEFLDTTDRSLESEFGDSNLRAFGEGALDGVSLGGYSALQSKLSDDGGFARQQTAERNATASTVGELGGVLAATLATGGLGAAGTVARTGVAAGRTARGASLAARALRATPTSLAARAAASAAAKVAGKSKLARFAVEGALDGALFTAGNNVSDIVLNDDPFTAEAVLANVGTNALFGGAIGAGVGVASKALSKAAKVNTSFDAISGAYASRITKSADEAASLANQAAGAGSKSLVSGAKANLVKHFGKELDFSPSLLARKTPKQAAKAAKSLDDYQRALESFDATNGTKLADELADTALLRQGLPESLVKKLEKLDGKALHELAPDVFSKLTKLENLGPLGDELLKSYAVVRGLSQSGLSKGLGSLVGAAGTVGAMAAGGLPGLAKMGIAKIAIKPLAKIAAVSRAVQGTRQAISKSVSGLVKGGAKASGKTARSAHKAITTRIGDKAEGTDGLARMREIEKLARDPAGLRQHVEASLAPIMAVNLQLGFEAANKFLARIEYLDSKIPQQMRTRDGLVKSRKRASGAEIQSFTNTLRAAEDPLSVIEDMKANRLTVEAIETVRALYPTLYTQIQVELTERLSELREDVPYQTRLQLSRFGVAVEPSTNPHKVGVYQNLHKQKQAQEAQTPRGVPNTPSPTKGQTLADR